jgi:predicted molibdopterin-dependent oxidoreductase YjgC
VTSDRGGGLRLTPPAGVERGPSVTITVDGRHVQCYLGESVAAALMAEAGRFALRTTAAGDPRGVFCGMGVCFDCLVVIDDVPSTRACVTWVRDGMAVRTQAGPGPRDE